MTHIRIADFCAKYGYTKHQIQHATRTGKLDKVAKGIVDEQHAIQAMSYTKPLKPPKQTKVKTDTITQPDQFVSSNPTSEKTNFLSQEWVKSMLAPASKGGKVLPPEE
jgi:malic enzyme